ncbi:MAG: MBOAT family protein [Lachnospiraceae bacterium]|nr:MBOAT family protein [Lachnospiraceae bacterium]
MVFSSSVFLFLFLPVVLALYYLAAEKYKNALLLLASLLFYAWGEPRTVLLMMASILINYAFGFLVSRKDASRHVFLILAVAYNLGVLFFFKYLNFAVEILHRLTGHGHFAQIALPIGISFYTFQIMSYVIDVYRGRAGVQRNVLSLGLYISLFPQLIAGPIVRYTDIEKQIAHRQVTADKAREGAVRFAMGFAKKVLLADRLAGLADTAFSGAWPSVWLSWAGAVAFTLQIYFDFSGYSDMAIGLGKLFGFDFLENFDYPYISGSIREFWRRWHISLGSWFKDYLYIPLGGSRKGEARTCVNYLIVFFLTGLWHGASFNFIVWGLYYAVFILLERLAARHFSGRVPGVIRHLYVLLVVVIGWVFFRADTLHDALAYLKSMVTPAGRDGVHFAFVMNREYAACLAAGILFSLPWNRVRNALQATEGRRFARDLAILLLFVLAICYMVGSGYSPFLYFRF